MVQEIVLDLDDAHATDRMFFDRLYEGSQGALIALLISLLWNLRDTQLDSVPDVTHALSWQPRHHFPALRTLTTCAVGGELH